MSRSWPIIAAACLLASSAQAAAPAGPLSDARLMQITLPAKDLDRSVAFYRDVLGLELLYAFPGMAFFRLGDARLYLHERPAPSQESVIYFRVEDIHAAHRQLEARGVGFVNAPHMIYRHPDGAEDWLAEFRDNEGRPMALMCQARAREDA